VSNLCTFWSLKTIQRSRINFFLIDFMCRHARVKTSENIVLRVGFWICLNFMFSYGVRKRTAQFEAHTVSSRTTTDILTFPYILTTQVCTGLFCSCCCVYVQTFLWASLSSKEPHSLMSQNYLQFHKLFLNWNRPINLIHVPQDEKEGARNWRRKTLLMW
jgi:hypothetical protein